MTPLTPDPGAAVLNRKAAVMGALAPPTAHGGSVKLSLVVIVDRAGSEVYSIDRAVDGGHGLTADDASHLIHHVRRKARDLGRDPTKSEDEGFFDQVASAVSVGSEIVVIRHGRGRSGEADHLTAYLQARHKPIHARIVREIVADLSCLTTPERLELGCHAFPNVWMTPSRRT